MVALHAQNPKLHQLLSEEIFLPERVWQVFEAVEQDLNDKVTELLRHHPQVGVNNVELSAYLVVQILETMTHKLVLHPSKLHSLEDCMDEMVRVLQRYLSATAE